MRLLIAEDDRDISKALVMILEKNNYSVDSVFNGKEAYEYAVSDNYDGIILDIMMPELDGIEVLTKLRSERISTPILLLTAKAEVDDRVAGLDAGADDYLAKPFAISELLARLRAMLRRKGEFQPDILEFKSVTLNKATYELGYNDKYVRLASREFQMLEMLMNMPGQVIPTDQFMDKIWGWDSEVEVSIVWVYISNLRKKFALKKN
ncbi:MULTISPECIES: response regulator transcription factor [Clostridium]|uniref:response regulator transcription factor n=1 Tax=Clostridium TaxID=1485 RepID=UPI0006C7334C|nr:MULTISPECIES: response regulator transcription factor [Clostridium]CUP03502.1 Response regulators consisting of a CheY-like receiver domain and a winged-helix DNA-binding domain [Clostridium disporicum]